MKEAFIVQRIENYGALTRTIELPQEEADLLYANWCGKIKIFNDQSISLIRVERTEKIIATHVNTALKTVE